jgi:uncharacterized membrane protein SpoIIM required for sporulation
MKVADFIATRHDQWQELERLCTALESRRMRRLGGGAVMRFAALYRAACADLALAESYQLPAKTVSYLHRLVGRAHNQLYRSRRFKARQWAHELCLAVPHRLYRDPFLRIAMVLFYGTFALSMLLGSSHSAFPDYAQRIAGPDALTAIEQMYEDPPTHVGREDVGSADGDGSGAQAGALMTGFYLSHNTGIGLRVFAWGLLLGIGGLYETLFNGALLGAIFGHISTLPQRENFFHFVTAHGPFELTAIVLSAAAGMRLGFSMVATGGLTRRDALRRAGREAMPTIAAAMVLFALAALVEGFISPSTLSYELKAAVAAASSMLLMIYFVLLGQLGAAEAQAETAA